MTRKIFYSWQSTSPNSTNRGLILKALEDACRVTGEDFEVDERPEVDSDTRGVPGAPDIVQTILAKIDGAEAFVCDVSLVTGGEKRSPNPNVLIELGYAVSALGLDRIVLVMNTAMGGPEGLPFNLRTKRVAKYNVAAENGERAEERRKLQRVLEDGLRAILKQPSAPRVEVQTALKVLRSEAERMYEHAQQLNTTLHYGQAEQYLPLGFRPALIESVLPQVIDHLQRDEVFRKALGTLRATAAAADEETERLLSKGGDAGRLIPLLRNVMYNAKSVTGSIDRLLTLI